MAERQARIAKAESKKVRRLSAWNVFQRSRMEGLTLSQDQYQQQVKALSREWRRLDPDAKSAYQVEAELQQARLDELSTQPLPSADAIACGGRDVCAERVWRNATKKVSVKRLAINQQAFAEHALWSTPTQLGDSTLALWYG